MYSFLFDFIACSILSVLLIIFSIVKPQRKHLEISLLLCTLLYTQFSIMSKDGMGYQWVNIFLCMSSILIMFRSIKKLSIELFVWGLFAHNILDLYWGVHGGGFWLWSMTGIIYNLILLLILVSQYLKLHTDKIVILVFILTLINLLFHSTMSFINGMPYLNFLFYHSVGSLSSLITLLAVWLKLSQSSSKQQIKIPS